MSHRHSITENPTQVVGIAAIAAAIGAGVAMLFTPRSGEQVRGGLRRRAVHAKDQVVHKTNADSDDVMDTTKGRLQSTVNKAVADTKSTVRKAKTDAKATKEDIAEKIRREGER